MIKVFIKMKKPLRVSFYGMGLFVTSLSIGLSGTVTSMIRLFYDNESVTTSPTELSEGISRSLISTGLTLPFAVLGFGLFLSGLIFHFNQKTKTV